MKICFVNLPWEDQERRGIRSGCRFPNLTAKGTNSYVPFPFLLAYAASYSEQHGAEVLCIDGVAERSALTDTLDRIGRFGPDLVVAETSTTSLRYDLSALNALRSRFPGVPTAVYGSHIDVRPRDALDDPAVDYAIMGEPELTSFELLQALCRGTDVGAVRGIVYKDGDGEVVQTSRRALIADIDELPYPHRSTLAMSQYNVPGFPSPVMFVYGSRGCPFKCTFCVWPQTNLKGKYRARSGEAIATELAWLLERYPDTGSFFFDDDTFNLGRTRVLDFAAAMNRRNLRIPWGMNARADNWDRELLERLITTGLFTLRIGIESGDQGILDHIKKDIRLDEARKFLELSHSLGIKNHVSFVVGLPGETPETIESTIRYIKSIPVDSVQFSAAIPFPGTALYDELNAAGHLESDDWERYNGFDHIVVRTEAMSSDDIARALSKVRRRVYFDPQFIRRRLSYVKDVSDLKAITKKALRLLTPSA
jgi:anaerobic magnesium-protoporphyrin IX monomethyl ester cyclase